MKKLLFLTHTLQPGGAEKVLVNILRNLDKSKYDITLMTIVNDGIYKEEIKSLPHIKYKYIFNAFFQKQRINQGATFNRSCEKIMRIIWKIYLFILKYIPNEIIYKWKIKEEYDIEISFLEGKSAKLVSHSPNKKSKKIAWIHTDIINFKNAYKCFRNIDEELETYKKFDKVICVSDGVKEQFIKKTGLKDNVIVKINPIDTKKIAEKSKQNHLELKKPNNFLLCAVGRLEPVKGYDRLLAIHKDLIQEGVQHTLWIVGEGTERKELEHYIESNKLQRSVKLLGFKENPYKYMNEADAVVCSSLVEGLSTVIIEALVLGKPIVTTNCPGSADILGKNRHMLYYNRKYRK